jgi:orotidine-5'-phosphate decarboxylase
VTNPSSAKDKIIVAVDVTDESAALRLVERLGGAVGFYKIGLELFTRCGPDIVRRVREAAGERCGIFLDLKFHDIPNTVQGAARSAATLGVDMLTVHLCGGRAMLQAAATGAGAGGPLILGVSVLTSSDESTLKEIGVEAPTVEAQVLRLARLGVQSGLGGVVASPKEIAALRGAYGDRLKIVTPGVRPAWAAGSDDQRRVMTPREAVEAGADYLVIGRPITGQPDPRAAAERIAGEIESA